ncbi:MAG: aldehyde dehydrogenase family protein [Oscillospiraceae bacterium]
MEAKELIAQLMERSRAAFNEFKDATQEQADAAARAVCKVIADHAEPLAQMAVDETGMGVYEHKVQKNYGKATLIWNDLKDKKSVGVLRYIPERAVMEIAKPVGVVCCIAPCTNPIVTPMSNAAFALKCRNSIIIAPHPRSKKCTRAVVDLFRSALKELGLPEDLVLMIDDPTIELSTALMASVDVVIATGGGGMVKAAYSSGKPAFGVGAGNDQCIVDTDADLAKVAELVVRGRTFDNGMPCTSEQCVIVQKDKQPAMLEALKAQGVYLLEDEAQADRLRETLFPGGGPISRSVVGQPVDKVAALAGIEIPEGTRVIAVKARGCGRADVLCREKMCPVLAILPYDGFEEAVEIAKQNLLVEGKGHCTVIHSNTPEHIEYVGTALPISRLVVNQCGASSGGGAWENGLWPTTTLGCGSWGNNSISDNFTYKYLMNVTRIGFRKENAKAATYEEIFG